jgi:hypothetical protein
MRGAWAAEVIAYWLVLDKKIGVGISVLKKSICFSGVVRCLPLQSSF